MNTQTEFERTNPRHDALRFGKGNEGLQPMTDPYRLRTAGDIIGLGCFAIGAVCLVAVVLDWSGWW
jgi:hypothetical protein